METIIERGIAWHRNQLHRSEILPSYVVQIAGPDLGNENQPARFHTYACLHPEWSIYEAINTHEWRDCAIRASNLRELIADVTIPQIEIDQQRMIDTHRPLDEQWAMGKYMARTLLLPVGMYVIGTTVHAQQVVYLMTILMAPLEKVVAEFKKATGRVKFK